MKTICFYLSCWRSFKMELSVDPPCQYVTWKVRDFLQLSSRNGYSLDSPEIRFAGDSYCLRLYPNGSERHRDGVHADLKLVRLSSTFPERNISFKVGYRWRGSEGDEFDTYCCASALNNKMRYIQSDLERKEDSRVQCDTLTALCSMCLTKQSSEGGPKSEEAENSDAEEELERLPGQFVLSFLWKSSKMELSVESPLQNVMWKVSDFFQLPSEVDYFIDSPEYSFADDSYCLRLYPNGDWNGNTRHMGLKVVRLTSSVPERRASCKVGYRWRNEHGNEFDTYNCPGTLTGEFRMCKPRRELECDTGKYVSDGIFTVICSMRLEESSGSGSLQSKGTETSDAEKEQKGLASVTKLQSDYRYLLRVA